MNRIKTGGPAFPTLEQGIETEGMTLRDYFAAKAMNAFICGANNVHFGTGQNENNMRYAIASYAMADSMLKAREQGDVV